MARVCPGEGKSWIIAMVAAFVAKAAGLQAHIVVDNATLLERDYIAMWPFFSKLKLDLGKNDLGNDHQVVYCLASDIEQYTYDRVRESGKNTTFANCVLIADELDQLLMDDNIYKCFLSEYGEGSDIAEWWYDTGHAEQIQLSNQWRRRVMSRLEVGLQEMGTKVDGTDYYSDFEEKMIWSVDNMVVDHAAWHLWLELKRRWDIGDYKMKYMLRQNVVCRHTCFSSYKFVFCLTGSLGTEAERRFCKDHFGASSFVVPEYVHTCQGRTNAPAKCVQMRVENTAWEQMQWTVTLVKQYLSSVPVLIVARDQARVKAICERLHEKFPTHREGDELGPGIIELVNYPGYEADFLGLVDAATKPLKVETAASSGKNLWRVTVTTPAGLRGQDFQITDDTVDSLGGMLLIMETVADHER
jgi:hypothetical protein